MIAPTLLADYFARNVNIVKMQIEGLSQADSLIQLPFRANCLNWVVGHMVTNRLSVLRLLAAAPPFDPNLVGRYDRESEPICEDGPGVLTLEELVDLLEQLQAQMAALLADIDDEALSRELVFFGSRSRRLPTGCSSSTSMTPTTPGIRSCCARRQGKTTRSYDHPRHHRRLWLFGQIYRL
jgi:hypothetical protein